MKRSPSAASVSVSVIRFLSKGWLRTFILLSSFGLLSSCFPPSQSGRPWYGESYANTPAYHLEKAKNEQRAREGGIRAEKWAAARREYQAEEAERGKQYQTRSWCEFRNEQRRREALAKGSQSYKVEDCSRYPR